MKLIKNKGNGSIMEKLDFTKFKWHIKNDRLHLCEYDIFYDEDCVEELEGFLEGDLIQSEWYDIRKCAITEDKDITRIKYYGPFENYIMVLNNKDKIMFIDINEIEPTEDCRCKIVTDLGRTIEVDYYEEFGIFMDDDREYGWKNNGENPELVIKWIKIK